MLPRWKPKRAIQVPAIALLSILAFTGSAPAVGSLHSLRADRSWMWPLEAPHPIVRPFVAPQTPYTSGHRGIDIAAASAATVRAPASGIVHYSGFVVDRNLISLDHGGGIISSFEPVLSALAEGAVVHRGQQIGVLQSGHCRASCLHLGVRRNGQYVSPLNYLGGIAHSVLLPTRPLP